MSALRSRLFAAADFCRWAAEVICWDFMKRLPVELSFKSLYPRSMEYEFRLFADYKQFFLMDDEELPDYPSDITPLDCSNMAKVAPYIVGVYTARPTTVPVVIRIDDSDRGVNLEEWDHVVQCGIDIPSGKLVVTGCGDYLPDAQRLEMELGTYRVRICYGNLDTVNGLDGDDYYVVNLWQGRRRKLQVLKQWENAPYF